MRWMISLSKDNFRYTWGTSYITKGTSSEILYTCTMWCNITPRDTNRVTWVPNQVKLCLVDIPGGAGTDAGADIPGEAYGAARSPE